MKLSTTNLSQSSLAALAEASAAINSSLDPTVVLSAIAQSAAEVLHAEASSVLLLDRRRKKMIFAAAVGDRGDELRVAARVHGPAQQRQLDSGGVGEGGGRLGGVDVHSSGARYV